MRKLEVEKSQSCIACHSKDIVSVHDFGCIPLADRLLESIDDIPLEMGADLSLAFCTNCSLLQIREIIAPDILFGKHYPYYTSISPALIRHFQDSARVIIEKEHVSEDSLIVEIASNDGTMLQPFRHHGCKVLGIDPSTGPAQKAIQEGVPTLIRFFSSSIAEFIKQEYGLADIILANNVLAHVCNLNDVVEGIHLLLKPTGKAFIEVPYVLDTLEKGEFDQVFHQHICYFSLGALRNLFIQNGLGINSVERLKIHGGSLRIHVSRRLESDNSVKELLDIEQERGFGQAEVYHRFSANIHHQKAEIVKCLEALKSEGARIAAYGAAGKANTFLNYLGIGKNYLEYMVDLSPFKQGKLFTGNHLRIISPEEMMQNPPDFLLITAWNFADEIMQQLCAFKEKGGKFIVPIPRIMII